MISPCALRTVTATRYVLPLREGGSLPGLVEADDLGMYVTKFSGAGQGPAALVAEVVVGELGRALGLPVPELVLVDLDPALSRSEPDEEVQDLLRASPGLNLGVDYLPGSLGFDPTVDDVDPDLAARVAWFDALVLNVDRSWRNPNLLRWHHAMWLIDHGAALYVQHDWAAASDAARRPLPGAADHVLLPFAGSPRRAQDALGPLVTTPLVEAVLDLVPDGWLAGPRKPYVDLLVARAGHPGPWLDDLEERRAAHV